MLTTVTFKESYRCFAAGEVVEFRPGLNLIVGDQGCGKSTVLSLLRSGSGGDRYDREEAARRISVGFDGLTNVYSFDFEKDSPRSKSYFEEGQSMAFQVKARFVSHGELNLAIAKMISDAEKKNLTFLLDEPDSNLSPRSVFSLLGMFKKVAARGDQILASVHNPILIEGVPEVLSLEHRRWMKSSEFMEAMRNPEPYKPPKAK